MTLDNETELEHQVQNIKGDGTGITETGNNSHCCSTALKGIQGLHEIEMQVIKQQYMLVIQ